MMGDISEIRTRAWVTRREKYGPSGGAMKGSAIGRRTKYQAKGVSIDGRAHVYANCGFDPETFEAIRTRAVREQTSFAEQVRTLVEWGLEAEETGRPT
jgi:hypothetical protein